MNHHIIHNHVEQKLCEMQKGMRDIAHQKAKELFKNDNNLSYVEINGGLGSIWYIRNNHGKYESLRISNGQMSDSELDELVKFLAGFAYHDKDDVLKRKIVWSSNYSQ